MKNLSQTNSILCGSAKPKYFAAWFWDSCIPHFVVGDEITFKTKFLKKQTGIIQRIFYTTSSYFYHVQDSKDPDITYFVKKENIVTDPYTYRRNKIKNIMEQKMETPNHYQMPITPVEFIEKNNLGFAAGNVIKYICRYKQKNGLEDLKKARHYIDLMIQYEYPEETEK